VNSISKRQLAKNPSLLAHLKAGEAVEIRDGPSRLVVSHPKPKLLSAEQIEADLERLSASDPEIDVQAVLNDLRG
jgi:hypothetical protein